MDASTTVSNLRPPSLPDIGGEVVLFLSHILLLAMQRMSGKWPIARYFPFVWGSRNSITYSSPDISGK